MCTVTCVPGRGLALTGSAAERLRVVFSRDEQHTRTPGHAPAAAIHGARRVILPRDPDAGGTWIAANDSGLVCALLNVTACPRARETAGGRSDSAVPAAHRWPAHVLRTRGLVIDHVIAATTAAGAYGRAHTLETRAFRPFRLLVFDRDLSWMEAVWTGERFLRTLGRLAAPLMRTSSGLGDARVIAPRMRLFGAMVRRDTAEPADAQDRFHRHRWPDRDEVSVLMTRADARTVSITTVEVGDQGVRMTYDDCPHAGRGPSATSVLPVVQIATD
jgi:hypothetical protein